MDFEHTPAEQRPEQCTPEQVWTRVMPAVYIIIPRARGGGKEEEGKEDSGEGVVCVCCGG